jgi:DMSO/TMAO reductase YedYZ molybdopterin-dependent catalytic subunit
MMSPFRPAQVPDRRPLIQSLERRGLIRDTLSLGALTMLTGCDVGKPAAVERALLAISSWNTLVQAAIFNPNKLAPTFPASMVLKPPKFNAYFPITDLKPVNRQDWKLELSGLITDRQPWTADRFAALPETEIIIKHVCVEGWDYIGQWSGGLQDRG